MHSWQISELQAKLAALMAELSATKSALTAEQAKPPVIITQKGEVKTETQIAYAPKEAVVYQDAKTGQEIKDIGANRPAGYR